MGRANAFSICPSHHVKISVIPQDSVQTGPDIMKLQFYVAGLLAKRLVRGEVSTGKTKVSRLNLECLLRAELLALVGELLSTRLMRTVLKLVRQILERL